jgi:acid phosphatase
VEENHSYSEVIGNSSMTYLNGLASQYGLATQYFADAHPSLPNYLMMTTGQMESGLSDTWCCKTTDDNVVRELTAAGKSWKAYIESLPPGGFAAPDTGPYVRRHNPFSYLSDVQQTPSQAANIVDATQFDADVANNALPQYSFLAPNLNNDAHNGSLAQADSWLSTHIAPLIASPAFQSTLLIITFDEGHQADINHGGGQVATIIVSPKARKGFKSTNVYQHQSTLRLALAASGVDRFPGLSAIAPDMTEFFTGP